MQSLRFTVVVVLMCGLATGALAQDKAADAPAKKGPGKKAAAKNDGTKDGKKGAKKDEGPPAKSANPKYDIHDENRPMPPIVAPGEFSTQQRPGAAPSDAIVLFDGSNLDAWAHPDGSAAKWQVSDGVLTIVPKTGDLHTKQGFGDVQLHIEWSADPKSPGSGQRRSNGGVFLMNTYEVQVLDNFRETNKTYADGIAASVYGQYPPLVNVSRPPGEWQVYDIIFRRPHFDEQGNVTKPAYVTVLHNGVLVQDHTKIVGPTSHKARAPYRKHPDRMPIKLQDHKDDPIRFRNIWVRDLESIQQAEQ